MENLDRYISMLHSTLLIHLHLVQNASSEYQGPSILYSFKHVSIQRYTVWNIQYLFGRFNPSLLPKLSKTNLSRYIAPITSRNSGIGFSVATSLAWKVFRHRNLNCQLYSPTRPLLKTSISTAMDEVADSAFLENTEKEFATVCSDCWPTPCLNGAVNVFWLWFVHNCKRALISPTSSGQTFIERANSIKKFGY